MVAPRQPSEPTQGPRAPATIVKDLAGKVAIVTGAGHGIGRATAQTLAAAGAHVAVVDLDSRAADDTARAIDQRGGRGLPLSADLARARDIERLVAETHRVWGRIDILHNNAAWYPMKAALETTEEEWDRTMAVCVKAAWLAARAVLPHMLGAGGGCIVNTTSVHGLVSFPSHTAYDTAKAGLIGLTRSLAVDYGPTVRVNALAPGGVETRLWERVNPTDRAATVDATVLKRLATPEEIAEGVYFLASDRSSFMTGACLVMDGGWTIV